MLDVGSHYEEQSDEVIPIRLFATFHKRVSELVVVGARCQGLVSSATDGQSGEVKLIINY